MSIVYRYMRDRIEEIKAVKTARADTEGYQHNEPIKKPTKKVEKWAKWHTAWPHGDTGDRGNLSQQAQGTWGRFNKIAGRVWFSNEELQKLQVEVEQGMELAIKVERKLGRVDWEKYVEEALSKKVGLGHRLTKLKEVEETPRASCSNGYHTGAKNVLEAEGKNGRGCGRPTGQNHESGTAKKSRCWGRFQGKNGGMQP